MSQNYNLPFDDKDLLILLQQNDAYAFSQLYQRYWTGLMRLAASLIEDTDTCQELVQELFVSLYNKRSRLHINMSISSYLSVSLRNRIRNHIRHRSIHNRHIEAITRSFTGVTNDVEQFINRSELESQITACLGEMPEKCRQVYIMYNQGTCPLKEIAVLLNRPQDTVEKQFRKAIHLLRKHLSFFREKGGEVLS